MRILRKLDDGSSIEGLMMADAQIMRSQAMVIEGDALNNYIDRLKFLRDL
jgi:hypothetical protein